MSKHQKILKSIILEHSKHFNSNIEQDLNKAFDIASLAYYKEYRLSGRGVLDHCLNTSLIVAKLGLDKSSIIAALLHECYSYGVSYLDIQKDLGEDIATLLENYVNTRNIKSKYTNINAEDEVFNEYIRRLILTFASDLRAVIIRLSEKLDNLSDVEYLPSKLKQEVINNAYEIYAPLAELIGINYLKSQIDETAYLKENYTEYCKLRSILEDHKIHHKDSFDKFYKKLLSELATKKVEFIEVSGRTKNVYSFKHKIQSYINKYSFSEKQAVENVKDKVAYRIICTDIENCYKALDVLHTKYKYLPKDFDDYIKNPKPNGYRSIHTIIQIDKGTFIEVQIRTQEMHEYNEYGPASHAYYKIFGDKKAVDQKKLNTIKSLVKWRDSVLQGRGFSTNQIHNTILAITPKGDVYELVKESTPIDFAYKVHSSVAEKAVRAYANNKLVPLSYILKDGDVVLIDTAKKINVNVKWLEFVKSKEARIHIKKVLKKQGKL